MLATCEQFILHSRGLAVGDVVEETAWVGERVADVDPSNVDDVDIVFFTIVSE